MHGNGGGSTSGGAGWVLPNMRSPESIKTKVLTQFALDDGKDNNAAAGSDEGCWCEDLRARSRVSATFFYGRPVCACIVVFVECLGIGVGLLAQRSGSWGVALWGASATKLTTVGSHRALRHPYLIDFIGRGGAI